jgi:urease accessory protein
VRGEAYVEVGPGGRCRVLRSAPPLRLLPVGRELHLVGTAAGPVGGDRLRLRLLVTTGAAVTVRSATASLVHPGPRGERSMVELEIVVEGGGSLHWLPQPVVLVRGCDHVATATIRLAAGATMLWREAVVLGRHAEPSGSLLQRLRVDIDDRPLLRNDLAVGPRWPGSLGPAGVDGATALATVLGVGIPIEVKPRDGVRVGRFPLGEETTLVSALATSARALEEALG